MSEQETYDVVIVGGGMAGLSAALVLGRARRRVLVVDAGTPRNAPAAAAYGFPTRDGAAPDQLVSLVRAELAGYGVALRDGVAEIAEESQAGWRVGLADGTSAQGRHLILASGLRDVLPDVPGARDAWGAGLLQCPYCHGWEVRDRSLGVIGASDASVEQAILLRQWSEDVTYFPHVRGLPSGEDLQRLRARGVRVVEGMVRGFDLQPGQASERGRPRELVAVRVDDGSDGDQRIPCVAVFCEPGADARIPMLESLACEVNREGCLATDHLGRTSRAGVWAVGNAADPAAHLATAAGDAYRTAVALNAVLVQEDLASQQDLAESIRSGA